MDPEAALVRMRELAEEIIRRIDEDEEFDHLDTEANDLAEVFQGLDEWMRKGGFPPESWQVNDVPEWLAVNWSTGAMWCRRCQTSYMMPNGPLKEALEHLEEFINAHKNCVWDRQVQSLFDYARHDETCQLNISGCGCNCELEGLLRDMGQEDRIPAKREQHKQDDIARRQMRENAMAAYRQMKEAERG